MPQLKGSQLWFTSALVALPSTETKGVGGETNSAENVQFCSLEPIYI